MKRDNIKTHLFLLGMCTCILTACAVFPDILPGDQISGANQSAEDNAAYGDDSLTKLPKEQIMDIAWKVLAPNTSSNNRSAWEFLEVSLVSGAEVSVLFEGKDVNEGCFMGPEIPANQPILPGKKYWYVQMKPFPVTPKPISTAMFSPTAPPDVPEPFLRQAELLIDGTSGEVVARRLLCIIY